HSVNLSALSDNTTYHFRVRSKDAADNLATSADSTFTTPDATPPVISGITVSNLAATSATIAWTTNEASDTQVEYGLTTAYGQTATLNPALLTAHSASLIG